MNKDTERGFIHIHRLLSQFNHWPQEALESNPLKLPTLRILRLARNIHGLEFHHLPPLHHDNAITTSIREASRAVDNARQEKPTSLQGQLGTKEYEKMVRQQCKPIQYCKKLLKHLAPLWELGLHNWINLLTIQRHSNEDDTLHIQPTGVIMARLPNGDKSGPKTSLRTSLDTLRGTLLLPANTELRKLPKDTKYLLTIIHASWLKCISPDNLPQQTTNSYVNLMKASAGNITSNKRPAAHIPDTLPTPDATNPAPLHIMEINDHNTLLHKTIYHVNNLKTYHLTTQHRCPHIHSGFTLEHLSRIHPEGEDTPILAIPFEVTGKATRLSEDTVRSLPNGNPEIHNYKISKLPLKKETRTPPYTSASPMRMTPPLHNLYLPPN